MFRRFAVRALALFLALAPAASVRAQENVPAAPEPASAPAAKPEPAAPSEPPAAPASAGPAEAKTAEPVPSVPEKVAPAAEAPKSAEAPAPAPPAASPDAAADSAAHADLPVDEIKPVQPYEGGRRTRVGEFRTREFAIYPNPDPEQRNITPITRVLLYVTRDHGHTWAPSSQAEAVQRVDAAGNPYFVFTAPEDGDFGFWIRMEDEKWATPAPVPGDAPQLLAKVDTSRPDGPSPDDEAPAAEAPDSDAAYARVDADFLDVDLHYGAGASGPSGLRTVHLWYTTDGGKTWTHYGEDPDARSPFRFHAPAEGVYGFRLIAVNRAGVASRPAPAAGDRADRAFRIVANPPEVRLFNPRKGEGVPGGGVFPIRWHVFDPFLRAENPIKILTSYNGGLSWQVLADNLPNTGVYEWKVPAVNSKTWQVQVVSRDVGDLEVASKPSGNFTIDGRRVGDPLIRRVERAGAVPAPEPVAWSRGDAQSSESFTLRNSLYDRASVYRAKQEWDKALVLYEQILAKDPGHYGALNDAGTIEMARKNYDRALAYFERALEADGENTRVRMNVGTCHHLLGHRRAALDRYREVALRPDRGDVTDEELAEKLLSLSDACAAAGEREAAGEAAGLAVRLPRVPGPLREELRRRAR